MMTVIADDVLDLAKMRFGSLMIEMGEMNV
jgi:hypothetical protein